MRINHLQIPITVLLLALVICGTSALMAKPPRYDWIYEFGKKPANFCSKQLKQELTVNRDNIYVDAHDFDFSGSTIRSILLTASGHKNCAGSIWYTDYTDWQNGFVTEFNMEVSEPTCLYREVKECDLGIFSLCLWSSKELVEDRCGSDGFVFVLQSTSSKALGSPGGGLSYLGIHNAFAIEFDTFWNEPLNDPSNKIERHISMILRKGRAEANEQDAIAWNDKPLNFKSDRYEAFLNNPSIRIEYLNKYIRVFINNILQLGYYDPLDLKTELALPSNQFYMGLTAATGYLTENHRLRNWKIWLVRPSPELTKAEVSSDVVQTNSIFTINVFLYEACGNRYVPIVDWDDLVDLEWVAVKNCQMVSKAWGSEKDYFQTGPAYVVNFRCSKNGEYTFDFQYKDKPIFNSAKVTVKSGPMTRATVSWVAGDKATLDSPFQFRVTPLDSGDNPAEGTTVEELRRQLTIVWPNAGDSKTNHEIVRHTDNTFTVTVFVDKIGTYTIKSNLFIKQTSDYIFSIRVGDVSTETSRAVIYDMVSNKILTADAALKAGARARLEVLLMDKNSNAISITPVSMTKFTCDRVSGGDSVSLTGEVVLETMKYSFTFEKSGPNQLKPKYLGKDINCASCNFNVAPGEQSWDKTDLQKRYESRYIPNGDINFSLQKTANFDFLLVLKDAYDNVIENLVASDYVAVLGGNYMDDMALKVENYLYGARLTVADKDLEAYRALVGRKNYKIKVKHTPTANIKEFNLEILSDGSDSDAGNGPVEPRQTKYWFNFAPASNYWATAGVTYQVTIQLCTKFGLRYNGWVDESRIDMDLEKGVEETPDPWRNLMRGSKPGVYIMDVVFKKAEQYYTYLIKFDKVASIRTIRFGTKANIAFKAWISDENLASPNKEQDGLELLKGSVLKDYSFVINLRDEWDNPTDAPDSSLNSIIVRHEKLSDNYRMAPNCVKRDLASYRCTFNTPQSGYYLIESLYFSRFRKFVSYKVYIQRDTPDLTTSEAMITNDLRTTILAGDTLSFKITVRDQMGAAWIKSEVEGVINNFSLNLRNPDSSDLANISITKENIQDNGDILVTYNVIKAGAYKFLPVYKSDKVTDKVRCSICDAQVKYNAVDYSKTEVHMLLNEQLNLIKPEDKLILDNNRVDPVFQLFFYDKYSNRRPVASEEINSLTSSEIVVPRQDQNKYNFEYSLWNSDPKLSLSEDKKSKFKFELANLKCTLTFILEKKDGSSHKIFFPTVALKGGQDDGQFTDDYPTPAGFSTNPSGSEGIAGVYTYFTAELKDSVGKLYNHPTSNMVGWYDNPQSALQLSWEDTTDKSAINYIVSKGKKKGSYLISLRITKAFEKAKNIVIKYLNPAYVDGKDKPDTTWDESVQYITVDKRFTILIKPADINYLQLLGSLPPTCQSDTEMSFKLQAFDSFDNRIPRLESLDFIGLKMETSNKEDTVVPRLTQVSDGVQVSAYCKKVGTVSITALKIKEQGQDIAKYTYNVVPNKPSTIYSYAELDKTAIVAGESVTWKLWARDVNDNKISFAVASADLSLNLFEATKQAPSSSKKESLPLPEVDDSKEFLRFTTTLETSGTHDFAAYYDKSQIKSSNFRVAVSPSTPVSMNSVLSKFDSKENRYLTYEESSNNFVQGVKATPSFKVVLKDKFGNVNPNIPAEFKFRLTLINQAQGVIGVRSLEFFSPAPGEFTLGQTLNANSAKWEDLKSGSDYELILKEREVNELRFKLTITGDGENDDPEAGNGLLEPLNTLITPRTPLETRAGDQVQFNIEVRTVNPNFRYNQWFDDLNKSIMLRFSKDDGDATKIKYSLERGDKKGRYIAKVTAFKTYSQGEPNLISVLIENVVVKSYQPVLIVNPGKIAKVLAVDSVTDAVLTELPAQSVDDVYEFFLKAVDAYDNLVPLRDEKSINLAINTGAGASQSFDRTPLVNGRLKISFQPKAPGQFTLVLSETNQLKVTIKPGKISLETSFATLANEPGTKEKAGFTVTLNVYLRDKWGNALSIEGDVLKGNNIRYFFQVPGLSDGFVVGENPSKISADQGYLIFNQVLERKGSYAFKVTLNNEKFIMKSSTITIIPSDIHLPSSKLNYFDSEANRFVQIKPDFPIQENNFKVEPRYSLVLSDKYGNEYDDFPATTKSYFFLSLSGNELKVVNYDMGDIVGSSLFININKDNVQNYKDGIYKETPYSLKLEMKSDVPDQVLYKVFLLGQGEEDKNATINSPLDVSKTFLSKTKLKLRAGEFDGFVVELRNTNSLRIANAVAKLTFKFGQESLSASYSTAEIRGRFMVSVSGTKSSQNAQLTVLVNDEEVPTKVSVEIVPSDLASITIAKDLSVKGSADSDYSFDVIPYDKYNNLAIVDDDDVNLRVVFPKSQDDSVLNRYTPKLLPESGNVRYTVECRRAGVYRIESPLLKENVEFTVLPGLPNKKYSTVKLSATQVLAGEKVNVTITAFDLYNNFIDSTVTANLAGSFDVAVKFKDVSTSYPLEATSEKKLLASFSYTSVGQAFVQANVLGELLACDACIVTIFPNAIDIKKTNFFTLIAGSLFAKTSSLKTSYGARELILRAQLSDTYGNEITTIYVNETFNAAISGNDMQKMDLTIAKIDGKYLTLTLPSELAERFSRLVPALNYSISLGYVRTSPPVFSETGVLSMDIDGKEEGAGNGELDVKQTKLGRPDLFLVAGEEQFITVELRTQQGLRYNGLYKFPEDIVVAETSKSQGEEKLKLTLYPGDKNGQFVIGFYGEKALSKETKKVVGLKIQNIDVPQEVTINQVNPARPDLTKVKYDEIPVNVNTSEPIDFLISLYDKFGNSYSGSDLQKSIFARAIKGSATFMNTTVDAKTGRYKIVITPEYPPRYLEIMVFFEIDENNTVPILNSSLVAQVKTKFAHENTDAIGLHLSGVPIGEAFDFTVLLKDNKGFCFEDVKTVNVKVTGPYQSSVLNDASVISGETLQNFTKQATPESPEASADSLKSGGYECKRFYKVNFFPKLIQKVGYYQIEVFIEGVNSDRSVLSKRVTYMTPGTTDPKSSVLTVPAMEGKAPAQLALPVNTTIRFFVNLHDEFRNRILENRSTDSVSFAINDMNSSHYQSSVENLFNGTFAVSVNVFKTGILKGMMFTINDQTINFVDLKKQECPEVINVLPGECSSKIPKINNNGITEHNITVGNRYSFSVQCLDIYGNKIAKGGNSFELSLLGKNLTKVGFDTLGAVAVDKKDGSYEFLFTLAYAGIYQATLTMDNQPYGQPFNISVSSSVCPDPLAPQFCLNLGKCAKDYRACEFPELASDCPSQSPFKCLVGDEIKCVDAQWKCNCPEGEMRCEADNKCVPADKYNDLCSTVVASYCAGDFSTLCSDGSCRLNKNNCPSQPGCPPGMRLCADQSCIIKSEKCPKFEGCNEGEKIYKCEDQTCAARPEDCPARIVCSNPSHVICPDNTCVASELECKLPPNCGKDFILCPDQSCRPSLQDCPQRITCPENMALCQDGSCRADCMLSNSTVAPKRTRLQRIMAGQAALAQEGVKPCLASQIVCPGGECAENQYMCPSVETCPEGSVRCPDQSCAETVKQCVARVCNPGEFHCWDGKCVKDRSLCSTRTSCPEDVPVKCTDGTCVKNNNQCPDTIACPAHSPYKCSTGDCRAKAAECPTLITCPSSKPVKCPDGSCVTAKYHCSKNVQLQKCDSDEILCPDGSCSKSKHLCPTTASCNENQVRCWDNTCTNSLENCKIFQNDDRICPSNRPLRCPDGTCRERLVDCPTQLICPQEAPIKCDDGTCKESITQCAVNTECSFGLKRCPDGSCTQSTCGTPITCPRAAPCKCYDSTCKKDPETAPRFPSATPRLLSCALMELAPARE